MCLACQHFGRFPFNKKDSGLKFRKFHVLNGMVHSGCTDPTQATERFVIVASQHTHNYALKVKSKYCLYPKEHSTVVKGRWKTKGGGILFRVESLWMQVNVKAGALSIQPQIPVISVGTSNGTDNFGLVRPEYSGPGVLTIWQKNPVGVSKA